MAGRNTSETLQSDWIMPPMYGGITCLAATSTEVDLDLTTIAGTPAKANVTAGMDDYNPNPEGHYLSLQADGGDVYVAFADTLAHLGTLSTTAVSTVTANAAVTRFTATGTIKIPNGTTLQVKLPIGTGHHASGQRGRGPLLAEPVPRIPLRERRHGDSTGLAIEPVKGHG